MKYALLVLALFLLGCEQPRYQMLTDKDGAVWRLDNQTGEMRRCGAVPMEIGGAVCVTAQLRPTQPDPR